jgi:hypothetical protein
LPRSPIQKREAVFIANKLGATVERDGKHQLATFEVDGIVILTFGIRHGKTGGHGHLCGSSGNLRLSEHKVVKLANCTMSKAEYIQHLKDIGEIPSRPEDVIEDDPTAKSRSKRHDKK